MLKRKLRSNYFKIVVLLILAVFIYSFSPYKLEFLGHYDKIWAHRVNSKEKLKSALKYYNGFELDLIYYEEENFFDVNHPTEKSINLKFEDYINSLNSKVVFDGFWLDMKNLNQNNASKILTKLSQILNTKNIPYNKVLIESEDPNSLSIFKEKGFRISYYLPRYLYKKPEKELIAEISKIKQILDEYPDIAISSSHRNYDIIHEYFPKKEKYIWALVWTINVDYFLVKRVLNDETVKVALVNYKVLNGNR